MASTVAVCTPICHSTPTKRNVFDVNPRLCFLVKTPKNPLSVLNCRDYTSQLSTFAPRVPLRRNSSLYTAKAASSSPVGNTEYTEESETKVKFSKSLSLPGFSSSLSLLGTGYREKVFAIIGVKVYAAGLYVNTSIFSKLDAWKGRSAADVQQDSSLFDTIFQAPLEKSLHITLVRDVDGKTFWDALDDAVSPRIKSPTPVDEVALSTFRSIFQGRALKKGTFVFLTWLDPTRMLVYVSSDGMPTSIDATVESPNVTSALFDVFLGGNPVSPSLKSSVASNLVALI